MTEFRNDLPRVSIPTVMVLLAGLVLGFAVAHFAWAMLTPSYTVKLSLSNAAGLRVKAPVELAGIPVGSVSSIRVNFSEPKPVEVSMRIAKRYQTDIRLDSIADITTAGLLGEALVDISRGSPNQPIVPSGGTLSSVESSVVSQSASDSCARLMKAFSNAISTQKVPKQ